MRERHTTGTRLKPPKRPGGWAELPRPLKLVPVGIPHDLEYEVDDAEGKAVAVTVYPPVRKPVVGPEWRRSLSGDHGGQ